MLTILIIVCLIWLFVTSFAAHFLPRVEDFKIWGESNKNSIGSWYFHLHKTLFSSTSRDYVILSCLVSANIARLCLFLTPFFLHSWKFAWLLYLILFLLILFFGDLFPRIIALQSPFAFFDSLRPLCSIFLLLALPFSFCVIKPIQKKKHTLAKTGNQHSLEKLRATFLEIMQAADVTSPLSMMDKKLLTAVLKFKDRIVREVMIPRSDLFALPAHATLSETVEKLILEGYSRIPIYRGNIDNIVGVVLFKDLFDIYHKSIKNKKEAHHLEQPLSDFAKGVIFTPESKKVPNLLQEFRARQIHMAIVVGEYGGTEGVCTIEDILEEIVGDISDEYDVDEEIRYLHSKDTGTVDAKMSIIDAEKFFQIQIPQEGDYDTLAGFVIHKVGGIPAAEQKISCEGFDIEVVEISERSVEKVRIIPKT